jgi:hypothetical protein
VALASGNAGIGTSVPALVMEVARLQFGLPFPERDEPVVVLLGAPAQLQAHTLVWSATGLRPLGGAGPSASVANKLVIIGSLAEDRTPVADRPGPDLIAWALMARTARVDEALTRRIASSPWLFAGMLLFVPGCAAWAFALVRRRSEAARRRTWLAAAFAATCGLGLLILVVAALYLLDWIYPQVTLVALAVLAAVALAWRHAWTRALWDSLKTDLADNRLDTAERYDIFISYSREPKNASWVEENLYRPLVNARRPDGSALRVFFDRKSIHIGASWYRTLARAIAGSRYFLPVYSDDYFDRQFCRDEMEFASINRVKQRTVILPLSRTKRPVPEEYAHINFIDANAQADFLQQILSEMGATRGG